MTEGVPSDEQDEMFEEDPAGQRRCLPFDREQLGDILRVNRMPLPAA
jgi:hypothetical protein